MSSYSPPRRDRLSALLMLAMIPVASPVVSPSSTAPAAPLPVVAVFSGAEQTSMVVDLGAGARPADAVSVTVAGAPQRVTVTPAVSDHMSVALVVDASEAGGPALPAWLSAAARFVLEVPAQARAVVVADTTPPSVIAAPRPGALGVVGALSTVRAGGRRSTSDALTLAIDQVRAAPADSRLVLLYTTSRDAGGEKATALTARFTAAGAILVVVGSALDSAYWSDVSRPTGGFFAKADLPVVVPALDDVATMLRGRYWVTFPTPQIVPAPLSIQVQASGRTLAADVLLPVSRPPSRPASGVRSMVWVILLSALLVPAAAGAVLAWRRTGRRPWRSSPPVVARGRASVPVARPPHPPESGHATPQ
jgi:hypothetical protein